MVISWTQPTKYGGRMGNSIGYIGIPWDIIRINGWVQGKSDGKPAAFARKLGVVLYSFC